MWQDAEKSREHRCCHLGPIQQDGKGPRRRAASLPPAKGAIQPHGHVFSTLVLCSMAERLGGVSRRI